MIRRVLALFAALVLVSSASGGDDLVLSGRVTAVTDGDTIKVQLDSGLIKVRFDSIDAPEKDQVWGKQARDALARRVAGQEVELKVSSQDRYDRLVATVYLAGESLNEWMVNQGHAWAYRQYTKNEDYCIWEGAARAAGRGMWSKPETARRAPWDHRAIKRRRIESPRDYSNETVSTCIAALGQRATTKPVSVAPSDGESVWDDCEIKGNISDAGKIYHLPGTSSYARTKIDESKGERWFCTEEEAKLAGWRPPKS
jgi:endonuclease YncB( thermonuclease family)